MWPYEEKLISSIQSALKDNDCGDVCPRCVLRLAGIKSSSELFRAEAEIQVDLTEKDEADASPPPAKKPKPDSTSEEESENSPPTPVCRACLGVLQESVMAPVIEDLCKSILNCGYDADHFTLALALPVSLALRSRAMEIFLDGKCDDFNEDNVVPIKQVWKWLFSRRVEVAAGKKYLTGDTCQFYLELNVEISNDEKELECIKKMCSDEYRMRQKRRNVYHMGLVTRQGAEKSLKSVYEGDFKKHYPVPPEPLVEAFTHSVTMTHNSIYIAGRYNKYSRKLPQTPWMVDNKRMAESSLEEEIARPFKSFFDFNLTKFSSSGREDVDVRMLGRGRPFLFEVTDPKKTSFTREEMAALMAEINKSDIIQVRDMQVVSKTDIKQLKDGEDQKTKTYKALCVMKEGSALDIDAVKARLEPMKNVALDQRTPVRVLHRRPNAIRRRSVYHMKVLPVEGVEDKAVAGRMFRLEMSTQAGTYVKEFVHGDLGRTTPNLRSLLGCDVDIAALDVEEIDLDWPKSLEPAT